MFKKTVLALAVLGTVAPLVAQADGPSLYGRMRLSLQQRDDGTTSNGNKQWDVASHTSRFGIKGDEDLGNGLKAFYLYEFAVDADVANITANNRLSYGGIKGNFGSVAIGKQWAPYYDALWSVVDPLQGSSTQSLTPARLANTLKYTGSFGPVSVGVAAVADRGAYTDATDTGDKNKGIDQYDLGVSVKAGPVTVAGGYDSINKNSIAPATKNTNTTGLAVSGAVGPVTLGAAWEQKSDATDHKTSAILASGSGRFGNVGVLLGYSTRKDDDGVSGAATKASQPFTTISYHFSKQTQVFFEALKISYNNSVASTSETRLGFRKDF